MAFRLDFGALRPPRRLPDGRLLADALVARTGVLVYRNPDGSERRELRLPEEVYRPDSLESFAGAPVTDDHPPDVLDMTRMREHAVGAVAGARRDSDGWLAATLSVFDAATINKMEGGKRQVSVGYTVDLDETPGDHPVFGRYDAVQKNIVVNHVAIVDVARAGPRAAVRMDAAVMVEDDRLDSKHVSRYTGGNMALRKDEDPKPLLDGALQKLAAETLRADTAEAQLKSERSRADAAEGALEGARARLTELEAQRRAEEDPEKLQEVIKGLTSKLAASERLRADAEDPQRLRAAVKARVSMETAATAVLGDKLPMDDLGDRELMCAVVEKLHGVSIPNDRSDDYVRARFDAAIEGFRASGLALSRVREIATPAPEKRNDAAAAREAMIERNRAAWRQAEAK